MKKKYFHLLFFLLILISGITLPVMKIWKVDISGKRPVIWRFRCSIYDPFDSFRGRYIRITPGPNTFSGKFPGNVKYGKTVYAVLLRGDDGIAGVAGLQTTPPEKKPFIKVRFRGTSFIYEKTKKNTERKKALHHFEYPFGRFFMNEHDAPEAEKRLRALKKGTCTAVVAVYPDGGSILQDIEVNGISVRGSVEKH